jgi:hypothetical protein
MRVCGTAPRRADIPTKDLFKQKLAMEERLDDMIERAAKRLVRAKDREANAGDPLSQSETQPRTQAH